MFDPFREVDTKDIDRHPADRGLAAKEGAIPFEMLAPKMPTRIKERLQIALHGIVTRDVRPLVAVAGQAREGQVRRCGRSGVLSSADVIDLKGLNVQVLSHLAVLATPACAVPDTLTKRDRHRLRLGPIRGLEGQPGLGLENIHKTADSQVLFQFLPLFGSDDSPGATA